MAYSSATHPLPTSVAAVPPTLTTFKVYNASLTATLRIPVPLIVPTLGSTEYVEHERTPNWIRLIENQQQQQQQQPTAAGALLCGGVQSPPQQRKKFIVCCAYARGGTCCLGAKCRDIHAAVWRTDEIRADVVHLDRPDMLQSVGVEVLGTRYPQHTRVSVHDRQTHEVVPYPTAYVLVTKGSQDWAAGNPRDTRRVFHCTHFREHGMCARGPRCAFFHVITSALPPVPHKNTNNNTNNPTQQQNQEQQQQHDVDPLSGVALHLGVVGSVAKKTTKKCATVSTHKPKPKLPPPAARRPTPKTTPSNPSTPPHTTPVKATQLTKSTMPNPSTPRVLPLCNVVYNDDDRNDYAEHGFGTVCVGGVMALLPRALSVEAASDFGLSLASSAAVPSSSMSGVHVDAAARPSPVTVCELVPTQEDVIRCYRYSPYAPMDLLIH
eukprot:PhM_4_TR13947/c2_g2_i6/m.5281